MTFFKTPFSVRRGREPLFRHLRAIALGSLAQPCSDSPASSPQLQTAADLAPEEQDILPLQRSQVQPRGAGSVVFSGPRIAIVGAGLAGLTAAYRLQQAGLVATVYEAGDRPGGRVHTVSASDTSGFYCELGAEFIDSHHTALLDLARELGLQLRPTQATAGLRDQIWIRGQSYSWDEVAEQLEPVLVQLRHDFCHLSDQSGLLPQNPAWQLDQLSLDAYLDRLGLTGWLRRLLATAYTSEYGLEPQEQSALNLVALLGDSDPGQPLSLYGRSDESWTLRGGNGQLTGILAQRLDPILRWQHRLVALTRRSDGYRLSFEQPQGRNWEVRADMVLLTLPFSTLRQVDLDLDLPQRKREAIDSLTYGSNAKLCHRYRRAAWREAGLSGLVFSDLDFQIAWESLKTPTATGLNCFVGGRIAEALDHSPFREVARCQAQLKQLLPLAEAQMSGPVLQHSWLQDPLTQGCYSVFRPGDWSRWGRHLQEPVENLYFAGEHCDLQFQGYMNGAVRSAQWAVNRIRGQLARHQRALVNHERVGRDALT
jgi:monoamine oxidase